MAGDGLRKVIKQDLLDQIERNGTVGAYYPDLVDDYMALWDTKNALIEDIKKRGPVVAHMTSNGTVNMKKNESVGDLLKVNAQMTKLLDCLGITPSQAEAGYDDEM